MKTNSTEKPIRISRIFLLLVFLFPCSGRAQVGIDTTAPKSTFEINGSFAQKVDAVTDNTTLTIDHGIVICNNGANPISITLPTAVGINGRIYTIKRNTASTANVTIAGTINGVTNLTLIAAGQTETIFSDGVEWKSLSNNAFGGATGHTKFEADGTMVSEGAATTWDDIMVFPDATSKKPANTPTMVTFKNGVSLWTFASGTMQEVQFTVQLPHGYKTGTPLKPHVHWTTTAGTPNNTNGRVVWSLEYTVMSIGGTFPATSTATGSVVMPSITLTGTEQHLITSLSEIPGTGLGISTILVCRLYRDAASATDDFANDAGLLGFDIHFERDTHGSRTEYIK